MSSNDIFRDRLPPQNLDAEKSVLGSMLRDNIVIADVVNILRADDFYFDAHQKIFQAISSIANEGHPVDLVILYERLKQLKQIEDEMVPLVAVNPIGTRPPRAPQ